MLFRRSKDGVEATVNNSTRPVDLAIARKWGACGLE